MYSFGNSHLCLYAASRKKNYSTLELYSSLQRSLLRRDSAWIRWACVAFICDINFTHNGLARVRLLGPLFVCSFSLETCLPLHRSTNFRCLFLNRKTGYLDRLAEETICKTMCNEWSFCAALFQRQHNWQTIMCPVVSVKRHQRQTTGIRQTIEIGVDYFSALSLFSFGFLVPRCTQNILSKEPWKKNRIYRYAPQLSWFNALNLLFHSCSNAKRSVSSFRFSLITAFALPHLQKRIHCDFFHFSLQNWSLPLENLTLFFKQFHHNNLPPQAASSPRVSQGMH